MIDIATYRQTKLKSIFNPNKRTMKTYLAGVLDKGGRAQTARELASIGQPRDNTAAASADNTRDHAGSGGTRPQD